MSAATGTTAGPAGESQGSALHISSNRERWVVFGIVLHSILVPKLRPYTDKNVSEEYERLKDNHNIHTQSATSRLERYPATTSTGSPGKFLKYENINGNNTLPKGKRDFRVKSHVDFAKLYLQDHMAKFNAFDDHCDASALLSLLSSVPVFSEAVRDAAKFLKDARNSWAHPDFTEWDQAKYLQGFKEMEQLVKAIILPMNDELEVLRDLNDWKEKGTTLCMNSPVVPDQLRSVQEKVNDLERELSNLAFEEEEDRNKVREALRSVKDDLHRRVEDLESRVAALEKTRSTSLPLKTEGTDFVPKFVFFFAPESTKEGDTYILPFGWEALGTGLKVVKIYCTMASVLLIDYIKTIRRLAPGFDRLLTSLLTDVFDVLLQQLPLSGLFKLSNPV